jgi:hypothetical protein
VWSPAYKNSCQVITLTDCRAALGQQEHQNAIGKDFPLFSQPHAPGGLPQPADHPEEMQQTGKACDEPKEKIIRIFKLAPARPEQRKYFNE